jgi:hypothetical protein
MNTTKHVVLLTSNIFGRGFDSRRLHQSFQIYSCNARKGPGAFPFGYAHIRVKTAKVLLHTLGSAVVG